jgi:Protein of unknown function (DUF3455)
MRKAACCAIAVVAAVGAGVAAYAQEALVPAPAGMPLLLEATADGVQIYACEAQGQGFRWVFKGPEATLFDKQGRQIGTHFGGPSWKAGDGSMVVGEVVTTADAPVAGAIPWVLLKAKSHEGTGVLTKVAFVRRAETRGGVAPSADCDASHRAEQARMRYSAVYQFFGVQQ